MATYKGKNTLKSVMQLARERAIYNSEVKGVTDFNFAEKTLYGRVDPQHNPIVADSSYLKPIMTVHSDIPLPIMVMNFVSEQFRDFERHFAKGCQLGFVEKDSTWKTGTSRSVQNKRNTNTVYHRLRKARKLEKSDQLQKKIPYLVSQKVRLFQLDRSRRFGKLET